MTTDSRSSRSTTTGWEPDVALAGFEAFRFDLGADRAGPLAATLVRRRPPGDHARCAVLSVHGYADYFFQRHVADEFVERGWAFYALDLRRAGRSLMAHQVPNSCRSLDEYHDELTRAIDTITAEEPDVRLLLAGHSTGGLIVALYAHSGPRRERVEGLLLNSPFLAFNVPPLARAALPLVAALGAVAPDLRVGALPTHYGRSIHSTQLGEWSYDLRWKPLGGFPVRAGWIRAVRRGHRRVRRGLAIDAPVLVLRSDRSVRPRRWSDDLAHVDSVLSVDDIARLSPRLGRDVRIVALRGALHDVMLSAPAVRAEAFAALWSWWEANDDRLGQRVDRDPSAPLGAPSSTWPTASSASASSSRR